MPFNGAKIGKSLVFLTNHFGFPALTGAALYKNRRQMVLLFKWIEQHLRIKRFYGTSENAVRTQIWIAVSVYLLVPSIKKRLGLEASLYTLTCSSLFDVGSNDSHGGSLIRASPPGDRSWP